LSSLKTTMSPTRRFSVGTCHLLRLTIRIGHRLFNGLQEVSGKRGGSADEGFSIVGLDLPRTPASRYETSEGGKKLFSR